MAMNNKGIPVQVVYVCVCEHTYTHMVSVFQVRLSLSRTVHAYISGNTVHHVHCLFQMWMKQ